MIRILQFFIPTKNLIKMFKAPTLPLSKKSLAITRCLIYHLKGMGQLQFSNQPQNVHFHLNLRCTHAKYPTFNPCQLTVDTFIYPYLQPKHKFKLLTEFDISVQFLYKKYSINVYEISDERIQRIITFSELLLFFFNLLSTKKFKAFGTTNSWCSSSKTVL